jgi:hypothetical protein
MNQSDDTQATLQQLAALLRRRVEIIADHAWRDTDSDAHLEALKSVSIEIGAIHRALSGRLPGRLEHFLGQCSFDKALAYIEDGDTGHQP